MSEEVSKFPPFQIASAVAGQFHRLGTYYANGLIFEGSEIGLEREPSNKYDPNAIKVMLEVGVHDAPEWVHIAYIAKGEAAILAPWLDAGGRLSAKVLRFIDPKKSFHIALMEAQDATSLSQE